MKIAKRIKKELSKRQANCYRSCYIYLLHGRPLRCHATSLNEASFEWCCVTFKRTIRKDLWLQEKLSAWVAIGFSLDLIKLFERVARRLCNYQIANLSKRNELWDYFKFFDIQVGIFSPYFFFQGHDEKDAEMRPWTRLKRMSACITLIGWFCDTLFGHCYQC